MTTIKSYTDLEQSKKLAEILPHESADMHYYEDRFGTYIEGLYNSNDLKDGFELAGIEYVPCWSLAALLELIRHNGRYELEMWEGGYNFESGDIITEPVFDAIDVCVEIILKLHEQNIL